MGERKIEWTAREALACAYCWAEFQNPENRSDTPEIYWAGITERARNECRAIANRLHLLSVVHGDSVAMPPHPNCLEGQRAELMCALGLKAEHRLITVYAGIFGVLRRRAFRSGR